MFDFTPVTVEGSKRGRKAIDIDAAVRAGYDAQKLVTDPDVYFSAELKMSSDAAHRSPAIQAGILHRDLVKLQKADDTPCALSWRTEDVTDKTGKVTSVKAFFRVTVK